MKNNPKKHMGKISIKGKEDKTKVEKEVFSFVTPNCNTEGFLQNTKGLLTVILMDSLLFYIRSSCWYFSLVVPMEFPYGSLRVPVVSPLSS